ncbi:4Fe-4S dicluster domain-containing protein [Halodesulfovibrio sp.]|jgi:carbon-monoxide dehydrogenase iron sulfur subunit|uniref:4Fe-4S dicluster domain-containing protein n=1 Tax=Halodesulfovibrio sp. TaxID=1912772 RepID=UPI0025DE0B51|nr:4Fe-4S dicluster domain-containing protein [Halodesulfovibrio sp.]MCT4535265.1 4Fe-4S dicluster domain-containing protein [Halodesulfovibrio sp.]MCT4626158.1 4Fe-4S dicluster domain-containing protein [Halodesulfovibrio sp.]
METKEYALVVDAEKCKGCKKCEIACVEAHTSLTRKEIIKNKATNLSRIKVCKIEKAKVPVQCHQCHNAPCARVCPTAALVREPGMVRVRQQLCVGCKMCVMVCPFGAINVAHNEPIIGDAAPTSRKVAIKCDQCSEWRAKNGEELTACAKACKFGAIKFVEIHEYQAQKAEEAARCTVEACNSESQSIN